MSLCIIKYTYTRYVGVDIEKYTRGLFEYVKEELGSFDHKCQSQKLYQICQTIWISCSAKRTASTSNETDIERRATNIPIDFQLEGLVLEINITNCDGTKYKKTHQS